VAIEIGDTCKRGHIISGDNAQRYINQGKQRVRCSTCNQPPRNSELRKQPGDLCKKGHIIIGDNLTVRATTAGLVNRCVTCNRDAVKKSYNKRYNISDEDRDKRDRNQSKSALQSARRAADKADELIVKGKDDSALTYLKLNKRGERASDALQEAMLKGRAKCAGNPAPYIDYDEELPPTKDQAYAMCEGCPVLVDCARFASAYRPAIGVWGGEVWSNGSLQHKQEATRGNSTENL